MECPDGELSISIVGDLEIAKLNKKYLDREGPTNVIAFPMQEGDFSAINSNLLGDVVISVDTAKKEGKLAEITAKERFYQLLVHGILHLFGYDHGESEEALIMEKKSKDILLMLNKLDCNTDSSVEY